MKLETIIPKKTYMDALKKSMDSHFSFGCERFTGYFLGSFFSVTRHEEYEWNRRITSQTNTAVGFVKKTEYGCDVHYLRFRGMLAPHYLLRSMLFLGLFIFLGISGLDGITPDILAYIGGVLAVTVLIVAAFSAFSESLTHESYMGLKYLSALLIDPTDPFSFSNNYEDLP